MLAVKDLMTTNPITVFPDDPLQDVLEMMQIEGFRQLPVMEAGKLVGIITDRDIRGAVNFLPAKSELDDQKRILRALVVRNFMTTNPLTVTTNTPAYRAAEIMSLYKFGALIVVNEDGTVAGIISVTDFLDSFSVLEKSKLFLQ
ncbi:MAG: CBS domain-containing protein [Chloroflexi bacterium]|nr:CBS domain-containing protein [Chloroflexota bacterium]